jgi:hypothetical protein
MLSVCEMVAHRCEFFTDHGGRHLEHFKKCIKGILQREYGLLTG